MPTQPEYPSSSRKRSRSPSDSESHKPAKRQKGGLSPSASAAAAERSDVPMSEANDSKPAPSVSSSTELDKSKESLPPKPEPAKKDDGRSSSANSATLSTIHMRCLIVTQDASIIIGKAGAHVNEIREKSGAKVMVSESIPGNPERILNVSGALDAVSKAFGLIVRRINDEPFDKPSIPGSRAVTIKFIIPNSRMGSVIGKGGAKIKEIQEASGARLNASEGMLPGSTERILSVSGVADAIHIATYYIGNILIQQQEAHGPVGLSYRQSRPPRNSYDGPTPAPSAGGGGGGGVGAGGPHGGAPNFYSQQPPPQQQQQPYPPPPPAATGPLQTQQIYIPNDLVGCIIGKGGAKINEIRQMSASQIKIMEPGAVGVGPGGAAAGPPNEGERLVVITGQPQNIQMAVGLLYHRLEQEKQKQLQARGL